MKKLLFLLLATFMLASCSSSPDIVGRWESIKKKGEGFQFENDGSLYFIKDNELIGGKNFTAEGKALSFTYELDKSKSPMWLDLIITNTTDKDKKEEGRILAIINIIDDNTIEIMGGKEDGSSRPISINTESRAYERLIKVEK